MTDERATLTYGNWRRPQSPGIAGMGLLGTGILIAGMAVAIILLTFSTVLAGIGILVVGLVMAPLLVKDRHGRNGVQRLTARAAWAQGRTRGWPVSRAGPIRRAQRGRFPNPPLGAGST